MSIAQPTAPPKSGQEIIGEVPKGTTHFSVHRRRSSGMGEDIMSASTGEGVTTNIFPIELCSIDFVRQTWGPSPQSYKFMWWRVGKNGKQANGRSKNFGIDGDAARVKKKKKLGVGEPFGGAIGEALRVQKYIDDSAEKKSTSMFGLMQTFMSTQAENNRAFMLEVAKANRRPPADSSSGGAGLAGLDLSALAPVAKKFVKETISEVVRDMQNGGGGEGGADTAAVITKTIGQAVNKGLKALDTYIRVKNGYELEDEEEPDENNDEEPDQTDA